MISRGIAPVIDEGMLVLSGGKADFDAFNSWTRSAVFPRHGRIDYISGDIFFDNVNDASFSIPAGIIDFEAFHAWTFSDQFPARGRIDFINGCVEVDMSPAAIQRHGLPKTRIGTFIDGFVQAHKLGQVFIDQTRVVYQDDDTLLSCEPDILFASWKRISSGEIVFKPGKNSRDGYDQMEVNGGPDLVAEVLSPSSIAKDTQRLKKAYFNAGVLEYWIIDALNDTPFLTLYRRGKKAFVAMAKDREGFQRSPVLDVSVKLVCEKGPVPNTLIFNVLSK